MQSKSLWEEFTAPKTVKKKENVVLAVCRSDGPTSKNKNVRIASLKGFLVPYLDNAEKHFS